MPLAEFFRMARGKLESAKRKETTCTSDIPQVPDNECAELLWENGQITVQGQSSRARRSPPSKDYQSNSSKLRDKDSGNGTLVDFTTLVPSKELGLDHNDDMAPWLNYPVDDSLQGDYSNILPELSGVTVIELSAQNKFSSIDKRNNSNLTIRGSNGASAHNGMSSERENLTKIPSEIGETSRSRTGQFQTLSFEGIQTSIPSLRLGNSGITNTNLKLTLCAESNQAQTLGGGFPNTRIPKQDTGVPNTNSTFVNFSHFRPSGLVRANLHNLNAMPGPGTLGAGTNCSESTLIDSSVNLRKEMGVHSLPSSAPPKEDPKPVAAIPIKDLRPAEKAEAVCQENSVKKDKSLGEMGDGEKIIEPVVASSFVCPGNGAQGASDDPAQILKRKCCDIDDCEGQSEDIEEESIGARKAASGRGGTGSKRGRAAEVHNLSERRRRDRINEKMRALQELIPNCNKVDKASMLDEAIEYLKTLQLQVQIMSMGAGLYMQPMMLPTGMQQMQAAHMARFSPMAVGMGMGMGMGFGMGMDMNASPRCPMIQVPTMQGTHFTGPHLRPISGPGSFQAMGGSNLPVYRHPAQGLPLSAAHANLSSSVGMNAGTPSNANDLVQSTHSVSMHNNEASSSENPKAAQHWPTNEGFRESNLVPKNDQPPDTGSSDDAILTEENDMDVTET